MGYTICRIPGDGIGRDVMDAASFVLNRMGLGLDWADGEAGWATWEKYGASLSSTAGEALQNAACVLYGAAITRPAVRNYVSPLIEIRRRLELHAGCFALPPDSTAFADHKKSDELTASAKTDAVDGVVPGSQPGFLLWRLLGEDHEPGIEFPALSGELARLHKGLKSFASQLGAGSLRVLTRAGCRRFCKTVLDHAADNGIRCVTLVHRAHVLHETDGLLRHEFEQAAICYPSILAEQETPARALARLLETASWRGSIAAVGLAAEMLQSLAVSRAGGPALHAEMQLGVGHALFQPLHGAMEEWAGRGVANPIGMIRASARMLEWLGETDASARLAAAIETVLRRRRTVTPDLGGRATTTEVAEAVAAELGV